MFARRHFAIIERADCPAATLSTSASTTCRQLFNASMPKVKYTTKKMKAEKGPPTPKAAKEFKCDDCNKTFTQRSNYLRHLGLVHEVDEFGNILPVAERLKLQRYNIKRQKEPQLPKETQPPKKKRITSVEFLPTLSSSSLHYPKDQLSPRLWASHLRRRRHRSSWQMNQKQPKQST